MNSYKVVMVTLFVLVCIIDESVLARTPLVKESEPQEDESPSASQKMDESLEQEMAGQFEKDELNEDVPKHEDVNENLIDIPELSVEEEKVDTSKLKMIDTLNKFLGQLKDVLKKRMDSGVPLRQDLVDKVKSLKQDITVLEKEYRLQNREL